MYVFVDTNTLINVFERNGNVTPDQLKGWLRSSDSHLVLTAATIFEYAAPIVTCPNVDLLDWCRRIQKLEGTPHIFLNSSIIQMELTAAVQGFADCTEPLAIDPFVSRFHESLSPSPTPTSMWDNPQMLVNYRLDEQLYDIWRTHPYVFDPSQSPHEQFREDVENKRSTSQSSFKSFCNWINGKLSYHSVDAPSNLSRFCKWLYDVPTRLPGARFFLETRDQIYRNTHYRIKAGDVKDLDHMLAIPYVDHAILDHTMAHYAKCAGQNVRRTDPEARMACIHPNITNLLHFNRGKRS